jgi:hypothetical protein
MSAAGHLLEKPADGLDVFGGNERLAWMQRLEHFAYEGVRDHCAEARRAPDTGVVPRSCRASLVVRMIGASGIGVELVLLDDSLLKALEDGAVPHPLALPL